MDFAKTGYCPDIDPKLLVKKYPDFMEMKDKELIYKINVFKFL